MGKFNISTTESGALSDVEKLAHTDLPIQEEVTDEATTVDTGSSNLEQLLAGAPASATAADIGEGVSAGLEQEQALEDQKDREFVPDIITRRDDETRVDTYQRKTPEQSASEQEASADGGLAARARNMATSVNPENISIGGLTSKGKGPVKDVLNTIGVVDYTGDINKGFLQMTSVITENTIADIAFNEGLDEKYDVSLTPDEEIDPKQRQGQSKISKAQANVPLGKQINREWHKYQNAQQGNPKGPIPEISNEQAGLLGDVAKELYFKANQMSEGQRFMNRYTTPDGQVAFELTKHGADLLKKGAQKRKRMFPKQHVRPAKLATPGGQLVGEGRVYTKRVSGKIHTPVAGAKVINEAMSNLNKVANVVDKQRLKILLATALPILSGEIADPSHPFAAINHVGKDKADKFNAKAAKDSEFSAEENYADLIDQLAQDVFGVTQERNGANHLTYYMQAFTGRIAPQQTHFDPTSSKSVRFVTRNATPSIAAPNSRVERNLRQMYAMMLVPGADKLLPAEREAALEKYTSTLVKDGLALKAELNKISDEQVEAAAEAISQGIPLNDPSFPKLPPLSLDPNVHGELIQKIQGKGEDGQAFIDGAIDFANYYEKKLKGLPHASYFNAYMDGKTNGLASNGIQMGSQEVAYKTGVIRTQNKQLLDNDEDLRDALRETLLESIDKEGFDGDLEHFGNSLPVIASKVFSNRDLNKSTTMTFGYGMELGSFKKVIGDFMDIQSQSDPELKEAVDAIENRNELLEVLHGKYVSGLVKVLDPNALKSRGIMKSAAMLHALTNELFSIESATGLELNFGGNLTTGADAEKAVPYTITQDGQKTKTTAQSYGEEVSAAAEKRRVNPETGALTLEPGGIATGGSAVGPVQSLDAATVALTASGKSWAKLRAASGGNPYLHTIYDAFKVDANGYNVVLDEVNNNWLDAGMKWSYLKETRNALDSLREKWAAKTKGQPDSTPLEPNAWKMAGYLMEAEMNDKGKLIPKNLRRTLGKLLDLPPDMPSDQFNLHKAKVASNIIAQMNKAGYNFYNPPATPTLGHLKTFIGALSKELNVNSRLNSMIDITEANKKELKEKIKKDGHKVYQYYSH